MKHLTTVSVVWFKILLIFLWFFFHGLKASRTKVVQLGPHPLLALLVRPSANPQRLQREPAVGCAEWEMTWALREEEKVAGKLQKQSQGIWKTWNARKKITFTLGGRGAMEHKNTDTFQRNHSGDGLAPGSSHPQQPLESSSPLVPTEPYANNDTQNTSVGSGWCIQEVKGKLSPRDKNNQKKRKGKGCKMKISIKKDTFCRGKKTHIYQQIIRGDWRLGLPLSGAPPMGLLRVSAAEKQKRKGIANSWFEQKWVKLLWPRSEAYVKPQMFMKFLDEILVGLDSNSFFPLICLGLGGWGVGEREPVDWEKGRRYLGGLFV